MGTLAPADAIASSTAHPPPVTALTSAGRRDFVSSRGSTRVSRFLVEPPRRSRLFDAIAMALGMAPTRELRPAPEPARRRATGERVLVVDDDAVNQQVATLLLLQAGYRVDAVADGAEAVEAVTCGHYAAVIMDCEMPVMDGYVAAAEIRRREGSGPRLPIIAVTASAIPSEIMRAIAAGMDAHVAKPVDREDLENVLGQLLSRAECGVKTEGKGPTAVLSAHALVQLRELDDGDGDALRALAEIFTQQAPAQAARIKAGAKDGDCAALSAAAHSLRGSAATFGAEALVEAAGRIEVDARGGVVPSAHSLTELDALLRSALAALGDEVGPDPRER